MLSRAKLDSCAPARKQDDISAFLHKVGQGNAQQSHADAVLPAAEPQAGAKRSMEPDEEAPVTAKRARTDTNAEGETFFDLGSLRRV